jgi:hypothetical protein
MSAAKTTATAKAKTTIPRYTPRRQTLAALVELDRIGCLDQLWAANEREARRG